MAPRAVFPLVLLSVLFGDAGSAKSLFKKLIVVHELRQVILIKHVFDGQELSIEKYRMELTVKGAFDELAKDSGRIGVWCKSATSLSSLIGLTQESADIGHFSKLQEANPLQRSFNVSGATPRTTRAVVASITSSDCGDGCCPNPGEPCQPAACISNRIPYVPPPGPYCDDLDYIYCGNETCHYTSGGGCCGLCPHSDPTCNTPSVKCRELRNC